MNLENIKSKLATHKSQLFREYPLRSMAIFGSVARREETDSSDLDILVDFSGRIGMRFMDLAQDLEKILNCKVDLVSKRGVPKKYFMAIQTDLVYV